MDVHQQHFHKQPPQQTLLVLTGETDVKEMEALVSVLWRTEYELDNNHLIFSVIRRNSKPAWPELRNKSWQLGNNHA